MPRKARNLLKASFYHVLVQGINKEYIFESFDERMKYKKLLLGSIPKDNLELVAYCIMNNHAHLLVKCNDMKILSDVMHKINTQYATFYNKKYDRVGYVFRDRYKSEEIFSEKYLCNCINYIHMNPVKAKICFKPEEYEFSNFNDFSWDIFLDRSCSKEMQNEILNNEVNASDEVSNDKVNSFDENKIIVLDEKEDIDLQYQDFINNFLNENKLTKNELKYKKEKLQELVSLLKYNNLNALEISRMLEINRESIRQILKM